VETPLTLQIARAITNPYDTATGDVAVHQVHVRYAQAAGSGDITWVGATATPAWVNMPTMCAADMQLTIDGKNNILCMSAGEETLK
jgi:hypothetical protein